MTEKELLEMPLHSTINYLSQLDVTRVPGGWIYTYYTASRSSSCFVPEPQKEEIELIPKCPSEFTCNFPNCNCFKPAAVISNKEVKVVKYNKDDIIKNADSMNEDIEKALVYHAGGNNIGGDV